MRCQHRQAVCPAGLAERHPAEAVEYPARRYLRRSRRAAVVDDLIGSALEPGGEAQARAVGEMIGGLVGAAALVAIVVELRNRILPAR